MKRPNYKQEAHLARLQDGPFYNPITKMNTRKQYERIRIRNLQIEYAKKESILSNRYFLR